ncbi:TRP-like ion channel Pkd2, partial [Cymbomonas tetramitiformis]
FRPDPEDDEITGWLDTQVQQIWQIEECGDGTCAEPVEFPGYGSVGCQADCGAERNLRPMVVVVKVRASRLAHIPAGRPDGLCFRLDCCGPVLQR